MRWPVIVAILFALVLVPFFLWEDALNAFAGAHRSAWWIGLLLAADVLLPIPSSVLSTAAGALLGLALGTLVSWLGMTAASVIGYGLGRGAREGTRRFVGEASLRRAQTLSERFGAWAIVASRPVPVLAEASAVLAGMIGLPWPRFLLLSAASNLGISLAYAAVGAFAMSAGSFLMAFAGAIGLPAVAMWWIGRKG